MIVEATNGGIGTAATAAVKCSGTRFGEGALAGVSADMFSAVASVPSQARVLASSRSTVESLTIALDA